MHGAVPFSLLAPATATDTVATSPVATPHAPPTVVTVALDANGNVRAVPLVDVSVTAGAEVSMVNVTGALVSVAAA